MSAARTPIQSLTLAEVEERLAALGEPKYRAGQVMHWLYEKRAKSFDAMSDLPSALRRHLDEA